VFSFVCCVSFDCGVILCYVLFVCCVLLYNHWHHVKTHLQLINITLHYITMKPRPGRLRLMTDKDCQALKKVVRETHQISSETITRELRSATNYPASTMIVLQELRRMGFQVRGAAHEPNISPVNAKRCLKWCKERRHWTVDNWKRVIWSDESRYTTWWSDGMVWVWRMPGE
jgi:hypothetical protein